MDAVLDGCTDDTLLAIATALPPYVRDLLRFALTNRAAALRLYFTATSYGSSAVPSSSSSSSGGGGGGRCSGDSSGSSVARHLVDRTGGGAPVARQVQRPGACLGAAAREQLAGADARG